MKRRDLLDKAARSATLRHLRAAHRHRDASARYATLDASVTETEASIRSEHAHAKACVRRGHYSKADYAGVLARQAQVLDTLATLKVELDSLIAQRSVVGDEVTLAGRARMRAEKKRGKIADVRRKVALAERNAAERSEMDDVLELRSYV